MKDLHIIREALLHVAVIFAFVTAVLLMALADVGMTVLLLKWSTKIRKVRELDQPQVPLPELPPDHKVIVLGGGIKKWD